MSSLHALAEMLRQLYAARQAKAADILLDRVPRDALQEMLGESSAFLGARVRYDIEDTLRHRKRPEDPSHTTLRAISAVLNAWLHDGRRMAIRAVLRECTVAELHELAHLPDIHDEVASMTSDFTGGIAP
ncbi:hypothetical protein [Luteibacter sp.]|uniref:hypothetical protein n=1 Tax=Luteibacter sp. TaxID=1886636 RepID=UPI003F8110B2